MSSSCLFASSIIHSHTVLLSYSYTHPHRLFVNNLSQSPTISTKMPHGPPHEPILYSFSSTNELVDSLAHFIIKAQKEAVEKKGRFTVAVSGGSLPKQLNGLIGKPGVRWELWFVHRFEMFCSLRVNLTRIISGYMRYA